jgi:tetratricopeptide (TPR) repeat protein
MAKKVKKPAKRIEGVDEALPIFERAKTGFIENWRLFTIGFVVLVLIVVAVLLWMGNLERKEKHASFLLSQGVTKLKEADGLTGEEAGTAYEEALKTLSNLVEEYGSTGSGELGLLYRGRCLSRLNRVGEAIQQYEKFLSMGKSNPLYRSLALQSLGFAYQIEEDFQKALACFRELAQMEEGFLKGESILAQARIYEKMGQQKEALEAYRDFLTQYPDSPESNRIQRRVALLEVEIR